MVQINFNAANVEPSSPFEALPAGWYTAIAEASEEKVTKAGTGKYLQFTFQVVDGPHAGRKLWSRLNVANPSEEAQRIGLAELSALCRAVGVMNLTDTQELHNKPLRIKVITEKMQSGDIGNAVKAYEPAGGKAAPGQQTMHGVGGAPAGGSAPAGTAAAPPPWAR